MLSPKLENFLLKSNLSSEQIDELAGNLSRLSLSDQLAIANMARQIPDFFPKLYEKMIIATAAILAQDRDFLLRTLSDLTKIV